MRTMSAKGRRFDGQGESMARRRYQQGSVFLRGVNPQWVGRYRKDIVGEDGKVKRVKHSVILGSKSELPTKRLAQRRLDLLLASVNAPEYRPSRISTVADFAERWTAQILSQRKPSTIRAAKAHLRCHIIPQLGKLRLDEIGRERQQVLVTLLSQKVSRKSVENIMGTLSSMITTARKWGYVAEPIRKADLALPDPGVKPEARFFVPEQVREIVRLANEPFRTMFYILAMTGVRAGELLGLTLEDIDFERRLLFIRRSVNRGNVQTVKSKASQKPLPLPATLAEILKEYLRTWRENPGR